MRHIRAENSLYVHVASSAAASMPPRIPKQITDQLATLTEHVSQLRIDMKQEKRDTTKLLDDVEEITGHIDHLRNLVDNLEEDMRAAQQNILELQASMKEVIAMTKQSRKRTMKNEVKNEGTNLESANDEGYTGDVEAEAEAKGSIKPDKRYASVSSYQYMVIDATATHATR